MATVYGEKVKEPRVTRRSVLPTEKRSTYAEDLAQAWASFGQAKSVLQKLETVTGSPPLKKQRKSKPYSVRFDSHSTRADDLSPLPDNPHATDSLSSRSKGKENQYIVEPALLNRHHDASSESESVLSSVDSTAAKTSPPRSNVGEREQLGNQTYSQPNPSHLTSTTTMQYRHKSPEPRAPTSSSQFHTTHSVYPTSATLSPSNPNNAGSPQRHQQPLHSNATAVFGPAVKFGERSSSTGARPSTQQPTTAGRKPPKTTSHASSSAPSFSAAVTKHQYSTSTSQHHHKPTTTSQSGAGSGRYVPIRRFELPAETVGTLKAQIELQKQAVRATSAKVDSLKPGVGFYPLPEASTATSSFNSMSVDPLAPHPPPRQTHSKHSEDYLSSGAVKKRKVASAPPPQPYVGFSSTKPSSIRHSSTATTARGPAQWQPNLERLRAGSASSATRHLSTKARETVGTSSAQLGGVSGTKVRKVHRFLPDTESLGAAKPSTTWSTRTKTADGISRTSRVRSPSPADVISETQSSPDLSSHSAISNISSSTSLPPPTRDGDREREMSPRGLSTEKRAGLTVDVAKLLEDLETSGTGADSGKGGGESVRPKRHVPGVDTGSAASKKPRYNFEPVYPTEKVRHYNQAEVQNYIQKKQEERKRRAQEDRLSQERAAKERQEKLRQLYDTQRKKVESNLRLKQRQRARALASGIHIHLHATASSPSLDDNIASPRLHSQVDTGNYRTSWSTTSGHTLHPSPPSHPPKHTSLSPRLSPHASPPSHTSPPRHTFHPSPPSHPPHPHTSPPRYSSESPARRLHYSPPDWTSKHRDQSHSPQTYPTSSAYSPARYVPTTTTTSLLHTHTGIETSTHPTLVSASGTLSTLLRGGDPTAEVTNALKTREDRISALTQSALRLKDRIASETRKLEEGYQSGSLRGSSSHTRLPYHHQASEVSHVSTGDLPGVQNIREHALYAERRQRESEAATKIQAAYRGYSLRKSLHWKLPSGQTLGSALRGRGEMEEKDAESSGTLTPVEVKTPTKAATRSKDASPVLSSKASPGPSHLLQPTFHHGVPSTRAEPWAQSGGDSHSVINIFTRQHEKLKETLNQLSNQKRAEIRRLGEKGGLTLHDLEASQPQGSQPGRDKSLGTAAYSYTESFEPSSGRDRVKGDESFGDESHVSSQFSQDSLSDRTPTRSEKTPSKSEATHHSHTSPHSLSVSQASKQASSSSQDREQELSAITPPGSPRFVDSFTSQTSRHSASVTKTPETPKQKVLGSASAAPPPQPSGRLSPRSLELKLQAELNLLETAEESMRQLSHMESTRAVSLAQQETVTLAQLLKSRQQKHEREMESFSSRAQQDVEKAQKQFQSEAALASKQMRDLQQEMDARVKEHAERFAQIQQESSQVAKDATRQIQDAKMAVTSAMMEAAQQQLQAAQTMAVSVASTAAQEAVKAAFREKAEHKSSTHEHDDSETAPHYESDFEPSTIQPDSLAESEGEGSPHLSKTPPTASIETHTTSTPIEEDITLVASEGRLRDGEEEEEKEGDRTLVAEDESYGSSSPQEELEDDISEVSFRELLPSESHRRQQISEHQRMRSGSESDDTKSLLGDVSRSHTPTLSPGGEDSFFQFMSHMVQSYMHEEEVRSRHQQTLLQLREKALEEKTKAELAWIKLKKKALRSKGADDQMPPLVKREKGLLRKLQHEQSEIRRLKEAQRAASYERKLMVLQQQEISKMRRSTQYYRDKIHKYRQNAHPSRTPSPFPSLDESIASHVTDETESEHSVAEEFSEMEHESSEALSEHLEHSLPVEQESYTASFPTYSPSTDPTAQPVTESMSHPPEVSEMMSLQSGTSPVGVTGSRKSMSPKTPTSDSATLKKLKEVASTDAESYLTKREQWLLKRRQAAEKALKYHEELLQKEKRLDQEEEEVNRLVNEAVEKFNKHPKIPSKREKKSTRREKSPRNIDHLQPVGTTATEEPPLSPGTRSSPAPPSEHITASASLAEEIPEEVATSKRDQSSVIHTEQTTSAKVPSEYEGDTFESLDTTLSHAHHPPITTSTPSQERDGEVLQRQQQQQQGQRLEDFSLSESLKITSSIDSVTTTSEASVIEARIRLLKEQLRQRKEEMKRVQIEQKRKKKALLKQQEEQLKRKLEAVENRVKRVRRSPPPRSTTSPSISSTSSIASHTQSERSDSEMSREQSMSPLLVISHPASLLPGDADSKKMESEATEQQPRSVTQSPSVEEQLSPVRSPSYTPFTDSVVGTVGDETLTKREVESEMKEMKEQLPSAVFSPTAQDTTLQEPSVEEEGKQTQSVSEDIIVTEKGDEHSEEIQEMQARDKSVELAQGKREDVDSSSVSEQLSEQIEEQISEQFEEHPPESPVPSTQDKEPHYTESFEEPSSYTEASKQQEPTVIKTQPEIEAAASNKPTAESIPTAESTDSLPLSLSGSHGGDTEDKSNYYVGQRVLVGNVMAGTVQFVGHTHFAQGLWVGVEIDQPKGRNDGSIDGQRYFDCKQKHGVFAPPNKVTPLVEEEEEEHVSEVEGSSVAEELDSDRDLEEGEEKSVEKVKSLPVEQPRSHSSSLDDYSPDFVSSSEDEQEEEPSTQATRQEPQEQKEINEEHKEEEAHPTMNGDVHHTESITENLESGEEESMSEQPAPASEMFNNLGEKPESLPLAPEVMNQRSQSATPTPAPPPEFAEGASRESSIEPPFSLVEHDDVQNTHRLSSELITDELAQELTNEAFETMHRIWKAKHTVQTKNQHVIEEEKKPAEVIVVAKDKDVTLTLNEKADRITDQLMALLLRSESSHVCDIHSGKKTTQTHEERPPVEETKAEAEVKSPRSKPPPLDSISFKHDVQATSPTKRGPPGQLILSPGFSVESSPPPLSPPSPYRLSPATPFPIPTSGEYSPPGSPPKHLSQAAAARVAAGEKTPFFSGLQEGTPVAAQKKPAVLERSVSTESISQLLESIKLTTAQCMVPSDRESVNEVVKLAWDVVKNMSVEDLFSSPVYCPNEVSKLFRDVRELGPEEDHCRESYLKLIFDLSVAIIRSLHPVEECTPIWLKECSVNTQLAQNHKNNTELTLETVQNKVYAALIRGQLPAQLPSVKFLYGMKRPGGREIDFVDTILIKELREEEPGWVNYSEDETAVKIRTADSILESLISETVEILSHIERKRQLLDAPS